MIVQNLEKTDLETLREDREAAQLRLETARVDRIFAAENRNGSELMESWSRWDPQDFIDNDPLTDTPRYLGGNYAEIRDGKQGMVYETEQDLAEQRAIGRVLGGLAPGKGILRNLTNFTLGTGFTYTAQARENRTPPEELTETIQEVIDDFIEDNAWTNDLDRELREREETDGEWFLALYATSDGRTQARTIEPEQITEPREQPPEDEDWSFGIINTAGDVQDVRGYWVQYKQNGPLEWLDTDTVIHSKNNVPRNLKRGVSSFRAVFEELLDARKVRRNTAKGSAVQAAIAWIEEMATGVSQSQTESLQTSSATMRYTQQTPQGYTSSRTRNVEKIKPGTVQRVENGRKFHPGPLGSERAPRFIEVSQACERVAGTSWCMPEYMVTGDASNANYSSTMVAESPFVRHCEAEQQRIAADHRKVLWVVIRNAARAGRFYQFGLTLQQIKRVVEIAVDTPRVAVRDEQLEATRNEVLSRNGILSDETWTGQAGLDYAEEQERGATKQEAAAWPMATINDPSRPTEPSTAIQPAIAQRMVDATLKMPKAQPPLTQESRLEQAAALIWEGYP